MEIVHQIYDTLFKNNHSKFPLDDVTDQELRGNIIQFDLHGKSYQVRVYEIFRPVNEPDTILWCPKCDDYQDYKRDGIDYICQGCQDVQYLTMNNETVSRDDVLFSLEHIEPELKGTYLTVAWYIDPDYSKAILEAYKKE